MKKFLLAVILFSATTFAFANTTNPTINETDAKIETVSNISRNKIIEFKTVDGINGMPPQCYERECWIGTRDNGNGTTSEVKVCGEWVEVTCPQPQGPQAPTMSIG